MKIKHRYCIVFSLLIALFAVPPTACADPDNKRYSADNRFIDNGNKTITATRTGLMWAREDSYLATGHWLNWHEAQVYVLNLIEQGFANYVDWQLPSIQELTTLFEEAKTNSSQVGSEMKFISIPYSRKMGREPYGRWKQTVVTMHLGSFSTPEADSTAPKIPGPERPSGRSDRDLLKATKF